MLKWIKIDENNKPSFKKHYLLGVEKKGFFRPERVYYGYLNRIIEDEETGLKYQFRINTDYNKSDWITNITHFIEIDDLPKVE